MEKLPPIEKVYEAWSAVADGRVTLHPEERQATVTSSNGAKTYTVAWNEDGTMYSSNDNHVLAGVCRLPRYRRTHDAGYPPA